MDRFQSMNVFIAVAEEQGFAAAARRLHMSPPAVTRAIAALEEHLGVKLLNRTTRFVRTTEAGFRYLDDARKVIAEADAADEAVSGINAEPRGHLAITAPVLFGRMFVMPYIVDYLKLYPQTEVSAVFLDRVVNLLEEGLDVAIRIGELPDSSMRAIQVGSVRQVVCASTDYLQLHSSPETPAELNQHALIVSTAGDGNSDWKFNHKINLRTKPRLTVTSNDAAIEAAKKGFGITRLLSYQIYPELAEASLQIILEAFEPKPSPIHIVHREGRLASARVRTFIDFMVENLRADKLLNP